MEIMELVKDELESVVLVRAYMDSIDIQAALRAIWSVPCAMPGYGVHFRIAPKSWNGGPCLGPLPGFGMKRAL